MYNARITKLGFVFLVIFLPFIKAQDDLKYGDTIYIQSMAKEHVWMKEDLYLPPHKIGTLVDYQLKKMVGNALVDIEKNPADELGYQFIFTGKTGCLKYGDKVQVRSNVENPDTGGTIVGASGMVGNRSFKRHHHTLILRSEEGNGDPDQKDSRSTECIKEKSSVFLQITQKKNWLRYNPDWYHMVVKNCLTCDTTERKKDVGEFLWKLRLDMGSGDRFPKLNWKASNPTPLPTPLPTSIPSSKPSPNHMKFVDSKSPLLIRNFASDLYISGNGVSTTITPTCQWTLIQKTFRDKDTFYIKNIKLDLCIFAQPHKSGSSGVSVFTCKYADNNWIAEPTDCGGVLCYFLTNAVSNRRLYAKKNQASYGANKNQTGDEYKWYIKLTSPSHMKLVDSKSP